MRVMLNGEPCDLPADATVGDAVDASGAESRDGIAVAVEGEVVPRGQWITVRLTEGQAVEVLQAVQGG